MIERIAQALAEQLQGSRWLPMLGATAAAYLFYFYADVYLEMSKPPSLIVFIGQEQLIRES